MKSKHHLGTLNFEKEFLNGGIVLREKLLQFQVIKNCCLVIRIFIANLRSGNNELRFMEMRRFLTLLLTIIIQNICKMKPQRYARKNLHFSTMWPHSKCARYSSIKIWSRDSVESCSICKLMSREFKKLLNGFLKPG